MARRNEDRADEERVETPPATFGPARVRTLAYAGLAVAALGLASTLNGVPAASQTFDCAGLRARIDALSNGGARSGQYAAALRQQQFELQRTRTYSASIGCESGFLFDSGPAECETIASRIERLRDSIAQLQQQSREGGDDGYRQRALTEQYNAYCVGLPPDGGNDEAPADQQTDPGDANAPPEAGDGAPQPQGAHVRALCVRHCDGGYFPITDDASPASLPQFDQLCKALCPATEASLYTTAPSAGIEAAVANDGTPYTSLPAAFRFQKTFDATCSCKPPHQSWVEALAKAEQLIERREGDVTVTQTMSDSMSRPPAPAPADRAASSGKAQRKIKAARRVQPVAPEGATSTGLADQDPVAPPALSGDDITRQLRRGAPTL